MPDPQLSHDAAEQERLRGVANSRLLDTPPEEEFDAIARLLLRLAGATPTSIAVVSLVDARREWFKAAVSAAPGWPAGLPRELPRAGAPGALLVAQPEQDNTQDEPIIALDTHDDARLAGGPLVALAPHVRFFAGIALRDAKGRALGGVCVMDTQPRAPASNPARDPASNPASAPTHKPASASDPAPRLASPSAPDPASTLASDLTDALRLVSRQATQLLTLRATRAKLATTADYASRISAHLESAQRMASVGSWERAADLERSFWSPEICRLLGIDDSYRKDFASFLLLVHPDDRDRVAEAARVVAEEHRPIEHEYRIVRPDGGVRYVREKRSVELGLAGGPVRYVGTVRDITEVQAAGQALVDSERKFRAIFELSAVGAAVVALDGTWLMVNRRLTEITGYSAHEMVGHTFQSMTYAEDLDENVGNASALIDGVRENYAMRKRYIRKDGRVVWVRVTVAIVRDADGKPAYFISDIEDIDESIRAEARLRESEGRYRQMFVNAPQPMWVGDRVTERFIDVNQAAVEHYGYAREEFLAMRLIDIRAPEIRSMPLEALAVDPALGEGAPNLLRYHRKHIRKDGSLVHVTIAIQWLDWNGRPAFVAHVNDITPMVESEQRMLRLNADLEERVRERTARLRSVNQELESFAYSVAHDLKAPLRGIHGFGQLLLEDEAPRFSEQGRDYLQRVLASTKHMDALINDLLSYSRLEREEIALEAVPLPEFFAGVVAAAEYEMQGAGIKLEANIAPLTVFVSRSGLTLALRNLIDNAVKFSRGAADPRIEASAVRDGSFCRLSIRDHGIGFDMAYHDKMFELFQRLHARTQYSGTGVGLAIVRKAMHRMGGDVWAEGAVGEGATFHLKIPLAPQ